MLFHRLVMSIYNISTAAIEKLLLLSLQFLFKVDKNKEEILITSKFAS